MSKSIVQMAREVSRLIGIRDDAQKRIQALSRDLFLATSRAPLLFRPSGKASITALVRANLEQDPDATPKSVRAWIRATGLIDLSQYTNPMAVIHSVMKRVKAQKKCDA